MDWNKRKSVRCLWSALVISTFVLCVCFAYISFTFGADYDSIPRTSTNRIPHSEKLKEQECTPVCESKDCVLQSKLFLEYVQPDFNPCDDFYKFACGKYLGNHFEVDSLVTRYLKRMRIKLRNILESSEPSPDSVSEKMKIVYDSCVKRSSETQAVPTLLKFLDEFGLENWPNITHEFKFENVTLTKVIANLLVHEEYGFITLNQNDDPTLEVTFSLSAGESSYEMKERHVIKFQINQILKYFKFDEEANIQEEVEAIHTAIRHLKEESSRLYDGDVITVGREGNCSGEMKNEWMDLCEVLEFFVDIAKANENVSEKSFSIRPSQVHFVENIFPLLRNFTDRSIANYLAINVILNHLNDLNLYFRVMHQKGATDIEKLDGLVSPIERWQYCVDWISRKMTLGLMREYMKKEFTITMLDEVTNLADEMIHETAEYFSRQEWVSKSLRDDKTEQIRNIKDSKSYKNFTTDKLMHKLYDGFKPGDGNFLSNIMEFRKFQQTHSYYAKIIQSHFRETFIPNASGGGGTLSINLGILFPPTFSPSVKRIFNIVSLGMIIVHEIGHSIFSDTFQFNQEEMDYLLAKVKCIADQVSEYSFELLGKNLDGSQYSYEDIADNIAVPIIDKLIQKYLSEESERTLPGLHYSTEQLLYTSSAVTWCSVYTKEKEELAYRRGTHSPEQFRIYQLMRNSKQFSETFKCPMGSFMNPANRCLIFIDGEAI